MITAKLQSHPDTPCAAVRVLRAEIDCSATLLRTRYILEGDLDALLIPSAVISLSQRADKLWQHTCFEIFLASSAGDEYCEFNFSPSTQWAAYAFTSYRAGMRDLDATPTVQFHRHAQTVELEATITLSELPRQMADAIDLAAVSAVIEQVDGTISYWALAHPTGKPDFHHRNGFILNLQRD